MTLSQPVKVVVIAGAALAIGGGGLFLVISQRPPAVIHVATPAHQPLHAVTPKRATPSPDSGLPKTLQHALARHRVVVAVLNVPGAPGDAATVRAARTGANKAHAGFATLDVSNEAVAGALALKLPGSSDPSILVLRAPGTIVFLLNGYLDSAVVAQAAEDGLR